MLYKTFGSEFSAILERNGYSCAGVGGKIKVPCNRISDIVRNRRGVTAETSFLLGRLFDVHAGYFIMRYTAYISLQDMQERFDAGLVTQAELSETQTALGLDQPSHLLYDQLNAPVECKSAA
mgnify:FL=1